MWVCVCGGMGGRVSNISRDKRPNQTQKAMSYVNKDCDVTMLTILKEKVGRGDACARRAGATLEER